MPHNTASNSRSNTTSSATHAQAQLDGQQATTRKTVRTRLVELGYYFMNAQGAIPTADIYAKFYPNTPSLMACEKAFSRDRKALEEFGFSIEQIKEGNYNYYWRVNQSKSFLSQSITALQAQYLITLLQPLVDDPSFARSVDLHYALMRLASISTNAHQALAACVPTSGAAGNDGSEGNTSTASHSSTTSTASQSSTANKSRKTGEQTLRAREKQLINTRMLEVVTDAQRTKHLVDATYTTSDGATKKYLLAVLGMFGVYSHLYVSAEKYNYPLKTDPSYSAIPTGAIRTFRLSRFVSGRIITLRQAATNIPNKRGSSKLPIHLGKPQQKVTLVVQPADFERLHSYIHGEDVEPITNSAESTAPVAYRWHTTMRCAESTYRWLIEQGIIPLEPHHVRDAWYELLTCAEHTIAKRNNADAYKECMPPKNHTNATVHAQTQSKNAALAGAYGNMRAPKLTRKYVPRKSVEEETRIMLSLLSRLKHNGDSIQKDEIVAQYACTPQEAQTYLERLLELSNVTNDIYLPITYYEAAKTTQQSEDGDNTTNVTDVRNTKDTKDDENEIIEAVVLQNQTADDCIYAGKSLAFPVREIEALQEGFLTLGITNAQQAQDAQDTKHAQDAQAQDAKAPFPTCANDQIASPITAALKTIAHAIVHRQALVFLYPTKNAGAAAERLVWPLCTTYANQTWYMHGWDMHEGAHKTYACSRMQQVRTQTAAQPEIPQLPEDTTEPVRCIVSKRLLDNLWWPQESIIEQESSDNVVLRVQAFSSIWLTKRLVAYADEIIPLETTRTSNYINLLAWISTCKKLFEQSAAWNAAWGSSRKTASHNE